MLGVFLGLLIGVVTGVALALLLGSAARARGQWGVITAVIGELLGLPTFWFGGPWVTTEWLRLADRADILLPYVVTLTIVFCVIVVRPVIKLIEAVEIRLSRWGNE